MDIYSIIERLKPFWLPLSLGVAGLILLLLGFVSLAHPQPKQDIVFQKAINQSTQADEKLSVAKSRSAGITIDIEGGVVRPGVYSLASDSRIQDALLAAGGLSTTANHDAVAKALNLAAKLTDGAKIYIPVLGDPSAGLASGDSTQTVLGAGTLNINSASASDLDKLPGIGEVTAQKIIGGRPYGAIDELLSKKIVSQKVFSEIKDKISVY